MKQTLPYSQIRPPRGRYIQKELYLLFEYRKIFKVKIATDFEAYRSYIPYVNPFAKVKPSFGY